jgi:hypothetical protein
VLWALAHCRHWTPRLGDLDAALERSGGPGRLRPSEVSIALWAFATLGHPPAALLRRLTPAWTYRPPAAAGRAGANAAKAANGANGSGGARPAASALGAFTPGQLAAAAWALAALQQTSGAPFASLWAEVVRRGEAMLAAAPGAPTSASSAAGAPVRVQLWQAALSIRLDAGSPEALDVRSPPAAALLAACEVAFRRETGALRARAHSSYQRGVANALTALRVMHQLEDNTSGAPPLPICIFRAAGQSGWGG